MFSAYIYRGKNTRRDISHHLPGPVILIRPEALCQYQAPLAPRYGRTGPYRERAGFDLVAQGASGLMSITGPGQDDGPVKVGAPVTDITAGILAAMGAAAAYAGKQKTGLGTRVDTSLFEAGITHTYWQSAIALATGESPRRLVQHIH